MIGDGRYHDYQPLRSLASRDLNQAPVSLSRFHSFRDSMWPRILCVSFLLMRVKATWMTKLPRNFIDTYEHVYGKSSVPTAQLKEDLAILKQGAEEGFMVPALGASSFSSGNSVATIASVDILGYVHGLADQFLKLLDLDKWNEEAHEQEMLHLEELQNSVEQMATSLKDDWSFVAKRHLDLDQRQTDLDQQQKDLGEKLDRLKAEERELDRRDEELRRKEQERQAEAERLRQRRQSWSFSASADPIICPEDADGHKAEEFCVDYKGPATVMCFDRLGKLQSIDFVGVCDEDGQNCQSRDAEWVGEQWRFDVIRRTFKYRNVSGQKVADVSCAGNWTSEVPPTSMPDPDWLQAFNHGRSFLLHARQPRIADGPSFEPFFA